MFKWSIFVILAIIMCNRSSDNQRCPNNQGYEHYSISVENISEVYNITRETFVPVRISSGRSLSSLSGLSRAIILAMYQACKITGSSTTNRVTMAYLTLIVGSSKNCIRTVLNRLKAKELLRAVAYKNGRGGWVIYELSQDLYTNIARTEMLNNSSFGPSVNLTPNGDRIDWLTFTNTLF